ncbi:hypothetical protein OJM17_gp035 [uncultured phage cr23_1]|uniref:hypothetical protein n=1 Tax=uncultured phage cr23_1 TaxID=2986419 RepID=UPI001C75EB79|nr:hypothetical protein OJM17_gp035 [uncultured phage cr23_1]
MDRNETIKHLLEKYPEDLNDNYNCYWWYTCDLDENGLKYHLLLRDKIARVDEKPLISLRAHSSDPKSLINLLELYLETCKY